MSLYDLTSRPGSDASFTLVVLHHAGGSARGYLPWAGHLPSDWRLLGVDLPGRLPSPAGPVCRTVPQAVDHLHTVLRPQLRGPYAVFGHSMGALLGYELVRVLEASPHPPSWLAVSASPAPHRAGARGAADRRTDWPAERLHAFARELGGVPEQLWHHPRLSELVLRTLRNDLAIVDDYGGRPVDRPPLRTAIEVYGGDADPLAPTDRMPGWARHTRGAVAFHTLPGGHFYLFDRAAEVCARLAATRRGVGQSVG